jgi:hypothetical protein
MIIFVEDILSKNKIIAYHRTGAGIHTNTGILTAMMDIDRNGYRIGNKGMYGDGLYCTYKLLDQYRDYLITAYGRGIVEVEIPIKNYLCFEMGVAKFLFGSKYSLVDQIKSISPGINIPEEVVWISDALLKSKNIFDSSVIAKKFWTDVCLEGNNFRGMIGNLFLNSNTYIGKDLYKKLDHQDISYNLSPPSVFQRFARQLNVNGIMYVGKQDGHCVVVYEEGLKKVSFRRGCISVKQNYFDIPWFDLKSKETAESKRLELKNLLIDDPIIGKSINLGEYKIVFKTVDGVDGDVTDIYKKMKKDMRWLWEPYTSIINGKIEYDPVTKEVNINSVCL